MEDVFVDTAVEMIVDMGEAVVEDISVDTVVVDTGDGRLEGGEYGGKNCGYHNRDCSGYWWGVVDTEVKNRSWHSGGRNGYSREGGGVGYSENCVVMDEEVVDTKVKKWVDTIMVEVAEEEVVLVTVEMKEMKVKIQKWKMWGWK